MARSNNRGGTVRRTSPKDLGRRVKKKPCALCRDRTEWVDYKDVPLLRKYMSDRGKIRSRRVTGNCAQHQRAIASAIKTARELVLLPYTQRTVTERPGGRGGGRGEGRPPRGEGRPGEERTDRRPGGAPERGAVPAEAAAGIDAVVLDDVVSVDAEVGAVGDDQ
jgi:small subunit ribosomal protein S18